MFHDAALQGPVVRNHFYRSGLEEAFPGIHSFVLSALRTSERVFGFLLAVNRISGMVHPKAKRWQLSQHEFGTNEASLMESASAMLAAHATSFEMLREREQLLVKVVRTLVSSIEAKDEYTRGHSERVALFARRLALEIGFDEEACQRLYLTGLLHDVGKIGVSDATLKKPDRLSDDEFREVQRHPDCGWVILHDLEPLRYVLPGVLHHHERFDGRGYPDGLAGEQIPLEGRILAIADAYDAMTSDRPYRKGMPQEKAEAIIRDGAGAQWDPQLVQVFLRIMPDIIAIRTGYRPSPAPLRKAALEAAVAS